VNGLRGYYRWRGQELISLPSPAQDHYDRFTWKSLEPSMDVYDFSAIDRALAAAQASRAKFGFRVRSMVGYEDGQVYVPDYMRGIGWWADTDGNGARGTFIPDWNNPTYIARAQKLLAKLGERYGADARLSFLDMGLYGQYGEWTLSSRVNYATAPANMTPATLATKRALIDAHVQAFPNTQLLMFMLYSNFDPLLYAFSLPTAKPIGTRVDCIGQPGFFSQWLNRPAIWDQIKERWRVAPMITEYCAGSIILDGALTRDDALGHVEDYHVSAIGNGNIAYSSLSTADQDAYRRIGLRTGFRFHLSGLSMAGSAIKGSQVTVRSSWQNQGVAPAYENWQVVLEFRDIATRTLRSSNTLSVNLKQLLPNPNAYEIQSTITIPSAIASGEYEVSLRIVDPQGYRAPLALANSGRGSNGEYVVGIFRVD
jgi:hypothetical protein